MSIRAWLVAVLALGAVAVAGAAPGSGKIAYIRDGAVFLAASDGSAEQRIDDAYQGEPVWSPDGGRVAYLRHIRVPNGLDDLVPVVAAADGSNPIQLAAHGEFTLACWLDDATVIGVSAYVVSMSPYTVYNDLYAFEVGGGARRLTDDGGSKGVSPQGCAPDASAVAYAQQAPGYKWKASVVRADGSARVVLTPPDFSDSAPAWSPSGDLLAFARSGADPGLYVSDSTGDSLRRLTPLPASGIRWSPDAARLVFTYAYTDSSRCSRYGCATATEVRTIGADGSSERVVADGGSDAGEGWSPDGRRIILSRAGRAFVMNADGSCKTLLPNTVPSSFAWQPVPGNPPAPDLVCADLKVSTDVRQLDLPLLAYAKYMVTVVNQGNETASGVRLDQPGADGVEVTDIQPSQGTCTTADGIHCDLGALATGASAKVTVTVKVGGVGHATLGPTVSALEPDGDPFDNSAQVFVDVLDCTILGTFGADALYGTPGRDKICGRFGNDTIYGNAGNDVIYGGEGADTIYGGKGRDRIFGGGGNDVILARDGQRDVIDCGPEKDTAVVDHVDVVSHCRTVYRAKPH